MQLKLPVVRNPWDKTDYIILMHAPVRHARPGFSPEYLRVVGVNRAGEHKQFSVPMQVWELGVQRSVTLKRTDAPDTKSAIALPGSRLRDPWRVAFTVIGNTVVACAEAIGNPPTHYLLKGATRDKPFAPPKAVPKAVFDKAAQNPVVFVEVEDGRAATLSVPDFLPA